MKKTHALLGLVLFTYIGLMTGQSFAQNILIDDTFGPENSVTRPDNIKGSPGTLIEGGARRGTNIFHSFESFNIQPDQRVYFSNPSNVNLILTRITGSSSSSLLGTIGVLGDADLFIMNPNGISFGRQFALDLNGSFLGTTATNFIFPDGTLFSSHPSESSTLLSIKTPIGLTIESSNASIVNQAQILSVKTGNSLALIGGQIKLEGGIIDAPQGTIEITGISQGTVNIQPIDKGWAFDYSSILLFEDIDIDQSLALVIDVGPDGPIFFPTLIMANGQESNVHIQGRNISFMNGSQVQGTGGNINVVASDSVTIKGTHPFFRTGLFGSTGSDLDAGDIVITAQKLMVRDGGRIASESSQGGDIFATGKGGDVTVNASDLILLEGEGQTLSGNGASSFSTSTLRTAEAGNLKFTTNRLIIRDGAQVVASTAGSGAGGQISVDANVIELTRASFDSQSASGIFSQTQGLGAAGNIVLNTQALKVQDKAEVNVSSQGSASAGNLVVDSPFIVLNNSGRLRAESSNGGGGNIFLKNVNALFLNGGSQITTTAGGTSTGGNITIEASVIAALPGGNNDITANALEGSGGRINIDTQGIFGFQVLTLEELQNLSPDLDPTQLPSNDITAISQSGDPTLSGQVNINTPETDPSDSTAELSEKISIPPKLAQGCRAGQALGNGQFANVGRGGLPDGPTSPRSIPAVWDDLRPPAELQQASANVKNLTLPPATQTTPIVEAKGWQMTPQGMMLVGPEQSPSTIALAHVGSC